MKKSSSEPGAATGLNVTLGTKPLSRPPMTAYDRLPFVTISTPRPARVMRSST